MSLGSNIRRRRLELNMTQQDLADAMGYKTRSTITKIESGENDVSQSKLVKLARVLDTTPQALMSGVCSPAPSVSDAPASARRKKTVAVILAGGKSVRNRQNIPNQFISILGKPVIAYCLEAYQNHPAVDDIYIVCLKGWENIASAYAEEYGITKLRGLIPAGASGILSVKSSLDHIASQYGPEDIIIFQESTRPMVSVDMISKLLQSCTHSGSANVCQSMRDYVQFTVTDGKAEYVDRNAVVDLQSPEAYRFRVIQSVFDTAKKQQHPLEESCCVMLMHNLGFEINFIEGSVNNIKIVRQEDIAIATALIKQL